jgi:hypothetical protein
MLAVIAPLTMHSLIASAIVAYSAILYSVSLIILRNLVCYT